MVSQAARVLYSAQDGVAVLTLDAPPVNALSAALRREIAAQVRAADADPAIRALVLIGAGRGFSGGADITEFGRPPQAPSLPDLLEVIEGASKPVIAALHGATLGGGLETALACHGRVAAQGARLGLPEVKLGLLPGAGGTQRLPRLIGVSAALEMIVSGEPADAATALACGLVDAVVADDALEAGAVAFARRVLEEDRPLRRVRDLDDKTAAARGQGEIFDDFRRANARRLRGFEAPQACIEAVQAAVELPFEAGLAVERRLFLQLMTGAQSAAQRYAFFAERQAAKIADIPDDTPLIPIASVGIIGAGTMGGGIAMAFLNAGLPVVLVEAKAEALARGQAVIRKTYEAAAGKGRMTAEAVERRLGLLTGALDFAALAECDLIIEAVFEEMAVKTAVFAQIDAVAKPGAILATNTSYLNVDEIAAATRRPEHVLGLHFFSPANLMRLLEVVRGAKTAAPVIATAMALAKRIGKVAVLVGVGHGFVGNRMLAARQREAGKLILEGALPWEVDRVLYDFGMPMGPFAMADLAGLDLGWSRERSAGRNIREILCEMDRRGQKTGAGFYDYDAARKATPSPVVEQAILDLSARQGMVRREIGDQEILERCILPMINEGAKILDEALAARASDIDVVWVNGYGWPVYRGGPMHYGESLGLDHVLDRLKAYQDRFGDDFAPSPLLERLARETGRFS